MISKGNAHADGVKLADYLTTGKASERAELWELRGFGMENISDAFRTVHVMAEATNCVQPFFHVQVRNRDDESLTREQWAHAADRIDGILGLNDQPRAIAFHIDEKTGLQHMHLAYSRIDEATMTARPLPFFKTRLKRVSRELERDLALKPVTNQREGAIKFAPTRAEHEQARRLGQNVHEPRETIRECWDRSDCGRSFQGALEHEGFTLAQGDRRGYVVIDRAGGLHALGKRILDVTAARILDRLSDLSTEDLPTVETARVFLAEVSQELRQQEQVKPEPCWDRESYDREWQNALVNAAIARDTVERKGEEQKASVKPPEAGVGDRKKDGLVEAGVPEPSCDVSGDQFQCAAKATLQRTAEPISACSTATEQVIVLNTPSTAARVSAFPKDYRRGNETRRKIRSSGIYGKALALTGIIRRQFRHFASLLTGHVSDPEREVKIEVPLGVRQLKVVDFRKQVEYIRIVSGTNLAVVEPQPPTHSAAKTAVEARRRHN